jgi:hypothetical protein
MVKSPVATKRLEEIGRVQENIKKLGDQFTKDFADPALRDAIERDLKNAVDSLDLLKAFYKAKTEK